MLMLPELIIVGLALLVLLADLFLGEKQRVLLGPLAMLGILVSLLVMWFVLPHGGTVFGGRFVQNSVSLWFKTFFLISGFFTIALSSDLLNGKVNKKIRGMGHRGEFYTILLFTLSGMMYLISARDLVTLYVALELATIPLFVLTAWRRDHVEGAEAGLKYVVVGALASTFVLYGLGILYGLTGHIDLAGILAYQSTSPAFFLAIALLITGIGFKMAMVPFHMWAADVYQGAPAPVTAYLSVASKGAGLAFMFQIFFGMMASHIAGWGMLLAIIATLTITLGNFVAIVQNNIKRFMAFSSISQAGYILLGFLGVSSDGISAMLFYMLVYVFTNLVVFGVIVWHSNLTNSENISDYKGLSRTNPLMALAMLLGLFSLAGIPPLSGFVGKFFLFSIAAKSGYHWLVAVAAVNSTISLYYYLRIVREMYIEPPVKGAKALPVSSMIKMSVIVTTVATLVLGVLPHAYEGIHASTSKWSQKIVKMAHAKEAKAKSSLKQKKKPVVRVVKKGVVKASPSRRVAPKKRAVVVKKRMAPASRPSTVPVRKATPKKRVKPSSRPSSRPASR